MSSRDTLVGAGAGGSARASGTSTATATYNSTAGTPPRFSTRSQQPVPTVQRSMATLQPLEPPPYALSGAGGGDGTGHGGTPVLSPLWSAAGYLSTAVFFAAALVVFVLGISGEARRVTVVDGYNEVFTVLGSLFIIPFTFLVYRFVAPRLPRLGKAKAARVWLLGLRAVLFVLYALQAALFMVYLVRYNGPAYYFFLIPDVAIAVAMVLSTRLTTLWTHAYIVVMALKMGLFWPNLDPTHGQNHFTDIDNPFGSNGFLAVLMITIPIIYYPVLVARLEAGMSVTRAYTTNMAAVFAHIMHLMDALELYMLGLQRLTFADDVQYMLLLFALMGFVSSNLYYITLFFGGESGERSVRRMQASVIDSLENATDESLLHYFLWVVFFIDLPYASMRWVAFCVHGTVISVFFAKNLIMIMSVALLLLNSNRRRQAQQH